MKECLRPPIIAEWRRDGSGWMSRRVHVGAPLTNSLPFGPWHLDGSGGRRQTAGTRPSLNSQPHLMERDQVYHSDPDILGGTPVFRGTRVPVQNLLDYLAASRPLDDFLTGFPSVSREQAVAFLALAKDAASPPLDASAAGRESRLAASTRCMTLSPFGTRDGAGRRTGILLRAAAAEFDVFVTLD